MIHPQALAPDAVIRVQCPCCIGHGSWPDPNCVPSFHVSPACMVECDECDGTGWLDEDEADAVPDYRRAET